MTSATNENATGLNSKCPSRRVRRAFVIFGPPAQNLLRGESLMRCTAGLKMACVREVSGRGILSNALHKGSYNVPELLFG